MKRSRFRVVRTSTWFFGFQTGRTYTTPWMWETTVFVIPAIGICFRWGWHCDDCREKHQ